jgi:biotin carboxyl carrier protein
MKRETLLSPLSGIINQIYAQTGSLVQAGEEILSIESMKLMYPVTSGIQGKINLTVSVGEFVQELQELGTIIGED